MERKIFLEVLARVLASLLFLLFSWHVVGAAELTKVQVQMEWDPSPLHLGYIVAREKGFYTEEGLEVEFLPGRGSTLVASIVGANKAPLGFIDTSVLLSAREKGLPLKAVAVSFRSNPTALVFLKKSGIKEPKDLKGKSILSDFKSYRHNHLLAFLSRVGLSPHEITIQDFSGGTGGRIQMLLSEKVDSTTIVLFDAFTKDGLVKDHEGIGYFLFRDYGIESISRTIVANEKFVKTSPETVRKFVRASAKGWEYAIKHPEESIQALVKFAPDLKEDMMRAGWVAAIPFIKGKETQKQSWGYASLQDWEETQRVFVETGLLTGKTPVKDAFMNEFLR